MANNSLNRKKIKKFFLHICRSAARMQERKLAKIALDAQLKRVEQISIHERIEDVSKIEDELRELEKRIVYALDRESKTIKYRPDMDMKGKVLLTKMRIIETKINKYLDQLETRQERIKQIEDKIERYVPKRRMYVREIV